jgi:pimeloyl-ACP methyl ester carboxylesterase
VSEVQRPDGASIHFTVRGDGPLVALVPYWSWMPGVYDEVLDDLAADHRVLVYHPRGTGRSSRRGPYDMETDAADLEAVLEAAGGPAVVLCVANAVNRATRVAVRRPDLTARLICFGSPAFPRSAFLSSESLVSSDTVIEAFREQMSRDYRGALRSALEATNPQMSQDELHQRVALQVEHSPAEAAIARIREWARDEPLELSQELGDRLTMLNSTAGQAAPWFPSGDELRSLTRRLLPQARIVTVPDGPISAPGPTAAAIREIARVLRPEPSGSTAPS